MEDERNERDFHHPYTPYGIQNQFMNAVYDCLEAGKVGIFESPTGTGKSLSLICGSLTWLRDHKRRTFEEGFTVEAGDSDEPAWIIEHEHKQKKQEALQRTQELNDRIAKIKANEKRAKDRFENGALRHKRQKLANEGSNFDDNEAQFALDDYESDEESVSRSRLGAFDESGISADTQALMEELGFSAAPARNEDAETPDEPKIFFCSRTHSQLTQFSNELGRVRIPAAIRTDDDLHVAAEDRVVEDVKHLTLGSRKNLCINSKVNQLGNATAINERCIDLQQSTNTETRCQYMPNQDRETLLNDFRDHALAKIRDIEDLGVLGKKLGLCPYYASRPAIKHCEVITLSGNVRHTG